MLKAWYQFKYRLSASLWPLQDARCHGCGGWAHQFDATIRWCIACQDKFGCQTPINNILSVASADGIQSACTLTSRLRHAIYRWKFHPRHPGSLILASLLCHYLSVLNALPDEQKKSIIIVPIPPRSTYGALTKSQTAHHDRLLRLSGLIAALLGVQWQPDGLRFQRATKTQHFLSRRSERFDNMSQAFALNDTLLSQIKTHQHTASKMTSAAAAAATIIVLDDLTTSGATLMAASDAFSTEAAFADITVLPLAIAQVPLKSEHTDIAPLGCQTL
jgi:predicted amidophosphoribosyltransferase